MNISSVNSSYSPVVSFAAKVRVSDSIRVQVDRVRVLSPGEVFPGMGAVTGKLEIQALLVSVNPAADLSKTATSNDRNGSRKPWLEHAGSSNVRLADSLLMGVEQTTGPLQFSLPLPSGTDLSATWLVFRITGAAVAMPARMADGTMAPIMEMPPIRVFACAPKNLDGKTDTARRRLMAESYSTGC